MKYALGEFIITFCIIAFLTTKEMNYDTPVSYTHLDVYKRQV